MDWWDLLLLAVYLGMIATAVVRRYPPVVYGVLVAGLLVGVLGLVLDQLWLAFASTALLLIGIGLFQWATGRHRTRSAPPTG
jgi:energy-coupling factor transporter transmembrane protein EcfT